MPPSKYAAVMQKGLFTGARINIDDAFAAPPRRRKRKRFALRRKDKRARIRRFTNEFTKKRFLPLVRYTAFCEKRTLQKAHFLPWCETHICFTKKRERIFCRSLFPCAFYRICGFSRYSICDYLRFFSAVSMRLRGFFNRYGFLVRFSIRLCGV